MKDVSLKDLLEAGCHFGHQTTRWNPKMRPYIYTARDRIHIFDLVQTKSGLEKAAQKLKEIAAKNGVIIYIGTKRQAQEIIAREAGRVNMPVVLERWIGGLISNWGEIKKRLNKLENLKAGQEKGEFKDLTKKERLLIDRDINRMERSFGGVATLKEVPQAIFVTDAHKQQGALTEARSYGVVTIAIADTNANPDKIDYLIPANDDSSKSIELIVKYLTDAIEEGKKEAAKIKAKEEKEVSSREKKETKEKKGV